MNLPTCYKLFAASKSILMVLSQSCVFMCRVVCCSRSQLRSLGDALHPCFSSHTVNKCPFHGLFSAHFSAFFFFFFLVTLLFKIAPVCSAEVPSSVPMCEKAVMCLMEKIHARDKLCLEVS